MKRAAIAGVALVAVGLIVFFSVRGGSNTGEKVYVEPATPRKIEAVVNASGQIDPRLKVNISAHVVGKIDRLYFQEGDTVKRGQKLVDLEKHSYVALRDRARAELANRRIEVARARNAVANAELTFRRARSLREQGIQAEELFDRARLEQDNARSSLASAEEGVRQAAAMLAQAENDLARTTIVSPIDGKAVQLTAREGEVVVTGTMNNPASVIAVIADLSQILVEAEVGETEVVAVRVGQKARVQVDAVPDKEYSGRVAEIGSSASLRQSGGTAIRYFKVKVAIEDADDRLRPGMTSQVSIVTNIVVDPLAVPIQSVVERVPGSKEEDDEDEDPNAVRNKYVFVVKSGKAKMTEVQTGISDATHVVITRGLKAADPVVTGPFRTIKKLRDGKAVQVTREESKKSKKG